MPVHFFRVPPRVDDLEPTLATFVRGVEAAGEEIVQVHPAGDQLAVFTRRTPKAAPAARKAVAK